MKTVAVANMKGGVGKSTLAVHLAWFLAEHGYRTLLIDLDPQANSSTTLAEHYIGITASDLFREAALSPVAPLTGNLGSIEVDPGLREVSRAEFHVMATFVEQLESLAEHFDVCVIDTSPAMDRRTESALLAADYFFTPVDVETYAIQGFGKFLDDARKILTFKQKNGRNLQFLGIVANKVNNASPMHRRNLKELIAQNPKIVVPYPLGLRTNIGEAIAEQVPVWKLPKTAARDAGKELRALLAHLAGAMGLKAHGEAA